LLTKSNAISSSAIQIPVLASKVASVTANKNVIPKKSTTTTISNEVAKISNSKKMIKSP
jgi:hypothetical protein